MDIKVTGEFVWFVSTSSKPSGYPVWKVECENIQELNFEERGLSALEIIYSTIPDKIREYILKCHEDKNKKNNLMKAGINVEYKETEIKRNNRFAFKWKIIIEEQEIFT